MSEFQFQKPDYSRRISKLAIGSLNQSFKIPLRGPGVREWNLVILLTGGNLLEVMNVVSHDISVWIEFLVQNNNFGEFAKRVGGECFLYPSFSTTADQKSQ